MLQADTFVEHCQSVGFEPAEAMMLYDELRRFAAPRVGPGLKTPVIDAYLRFGREGLEKVSTPEDFKSYRKSWYQSPKALKNRRSSLEETCVRMLGQADFIHRVSGVIGFKDPEEWESWKDLGLGWDDVSHAIAADKPALTAQAPVGVTAQEANEKLERAVSEAGLGEFCWPFALGTSPEVVWALANDLETCAQELAQKTGWGPASLGLGQRVSLGIGHDKGGSSGVCWNGTSEGQFIQTSVQAPWGPIAHEWMHAVDHIGHCEAAPLPGSAKLQKAWSAMHDGLDQVAWNKARRAEMVAGFSGAIAAVWSTFPETQKLLLKHVDVPEIDDRALLKKLEASLVNDSAVSGKNDNAEYLAVRSVMALTDLEMARSNLKDLPSVWNSYGEHFYNNARAYLPAETRENWEDYFSSREERATHSFESTFSGALVSDVKENSGFRYPFAPERAQHELVWKRFFRATKEWAQGLTPTTLQASSDALPELSMAARRRARLDAKPGAVPQVPSPTAPSLG